MKIMFLNKAHVAKVRLDDLCLCKSCMYHDVNCAHISSNICILYGGFQTANEEIFKI